MIRFFNRGLDVASGLKAKFERDERVLAVADTETDATVVVATNRGLWLREPDDSWRSIGWHDIVKATWSASGFGVIAGRTGDDGIVQDEPAIRVELSQPRNLPAVARARVEASIARTEQVSVPGGVGRLVARRVPGSDGVRWTARLDSGTPDSAAAREVLALKVRAMVAAESSAVR